MILMAHSDKKTSSDAISGDVEPRTWTGRNCIPALPSVATWVREELLSVLAHLKWTAGDLFAVGLAVEEALANAIKHGSHGRPDSQIYFSYEASPKRVRVKITDSGEGFDPFAVLHRDREAHRGAPSGRGLSLMLRYMDRVEYNHRGNRVILEKRVCGQSKRRAAT